VSDGTGTIHSWFFFLFSVRAEGNVISCQHWILYPINRTLLGNSNVTSRKLAGISAEIQIILAGSDERE
jgi:hypothetical protein